VSATNPALLRFHGPESAPVLTPAETRALDAATIEELNVPGAVLMEAAGRAAAAVVQRLFPRGRVAAAVGSGNNGGDAMVLLRTLRAWGREVAAVAVGAHPPDPALLHGWEVETCPASGAESAFRGVEVVVDGLLGTGARGAPREAETAAIEAMARAGRPVVALDGPSGIDLLTGAKPGVAVRAEVTVTFGALKRGLLLFPGREHAGRIVVAEIGLRPFGGSPAAQLVTPAWARRHLPGVVPNAHKGTMGLVSVVAGRRGMAGAAVLAGRGALRAGAGKVRLVSHADNRVILQTALPEALFADRDAAGVPEEVGASQAVVAGPGMGTGDRDLALLRALFAAVRCPVLLDADAVTLLAHHPELRDEIRGPLLLTPHPGEMGRLLGRETKAVTADPFAAAAEAAERFRCAVLLKGAPSLAAAPGEPTLVNVTGHSGIATGGSGDMLGGVAGALLAVGVVPRDAAALALYLCGRAAQHAGQGRSLIPHDVVEALPDAFAELGAGDPEPVVPGAVLDLHRAY
jgi:NAD(P)H-hydrate epimerase